MKLKYIAIPVIVVLGFIASSANPPGPDESGKARVWTSYQTTAGVAPDAGASAFMDIREISGYRVSVCAPCLLSDGGQKVDGGPCNDTNAIQQTLTGSGTIKIWAFDWDTQTQMRNSGLDETVNESTAACQNFPDHVVAVPSGGIYAQCSSVGMSKDDAGVTNCQVQIKGSKAGYKTR